MTSAVPSLKRCWRCAQSQGRGIEPDLVDSLAQRVEETVQRRYEAEQALEFQHRQNQPGRGGQLAVAIVSVIMSIPLTAIALDTSGLLALLVVWTGIVLVNVAFGATWKRPGNSR